MTKASLDHLEKIENDDVITAFTAAPLTNKYFVGQEISPGKCPVAVWSATQTASALNNSNSFPISSTHTKVLFSSGCQNF